MRRAVLVVVSTLVLTLLGVGPTGAQSQSVAVPAVASPSTSAAASKAPLTVRELFLGGAQRQGSGTATIDSGVRGTVGFSVFGVSWETSGADVQVRYRTRADGAWTAWATAGAGEGEQGERRTNTDAIVAPGSDGVHVVLTSSARLDDVRVVVVDPGDGPDATTVPPAAGLPAAGRGMSVGAAPAILPAQTTARPTYVTRAQWGADESLRTCDPDYSTTMASAAVHHTVSPNSYTADEAAGLVRGIYAYHTRPESAGGRGWCDIGYNALVDRFGRVYEGRAASFDEAVVGVHTGGFNSRTFGISVIGTFQTTVPPDVVLEALAQAIAWKFATGGILANTSVTMTSGGGASKYPEGTQVAFPTIYGHRDAQLTSCPGDQLYNRLQIVRDRVAALSNAAVQASPRAFLDVARADQTSVTLAGWAYDPETDAPLTVDVQIDRQSHQVTADRSRPDVAAAFGVGPSHGFAVTVPVPSGRHLVCIWVRNQGQGNDRLLGCRWLSAVNYAPRGFVDSMRVSGSTVVVSGWAFDQDATGPLQIRLYAGSVPIGSGWTGQPRPDVDAAFPAAGATAGFQVSSTPVAAGTHTVCAYAINTPAGANPQIGCRRITVVNAEPVGYLDVLRATPTSLRVVGWALDPDTTAPLDVHVYGGGRLLGRTTADASRPDVASAFPGQPAAHGFDVTVPFDGAAQDVCVYAINVPAGINPAIGCGRVAPVNSTPVGFLDQVLPTGSGLQVIGWAVDPDTDVALKVHVYVDGVLAAAGTADASRPDVAAALGVGAGHGFSLPVPAASGSHRVCAYAINIPTGLNPVLGCRDVTV